MTNEDKVAELVGAINAILGAAERGNDPDHDALAVIRIECANVLRYVATVDTKSSKFTLSLTYDRDEILADVQECIDKGGDIFRTKMFLDMMYPAWNRDTRTMCMVELMFRDKGDALRPLFEKRLAELDT